VARDAEPESPLAWLTATISQWLALFRGLTLASLSAASGAVAGAGLALLLFLLFTFSLAPPRDTFARPLALDFSASDLVGQALFLPEAQLGDGLLPATPQRDARFLAPSQPVDVWVELEVPRDSGQGVAQVVAQLTSLDGRVAAKASRAVMLRSDWWSLGSMSLTPLRWLGLGGDVRRLHVPLFRGYRDKREVPFMAATVSIKTRNPAWAAEVVSATLKVRLRLGLLRRAIYSLRPGPLVALALGCAAIGMLLGGGGAALLFLGLLLYAGFSSSTAGGRAASSAAGDEASSSLSVSALEEVSAASGISEASSSLLREIEEEEGEGKLLPPSPRPSVAAAAEKVERWLPSTSAAAAAAGGQGKAARPADSAMGGSEASAAAGMRRRAGGFKLF
jgi:hypothetical protein